MGHCKAVMRSSEWTTFVRKAKQNPRWPNSFNQLKGKLKLLCKKLRQINLKIECRSVTIRYNKLHADPSQGKTLDLILKKAKHRIVENMSSSTADALGLSRAILCNDSLLKKLDELKRMESMYRGIVEVRHSKEITQETDFLNCSLL